MPYIWQRRGANGAYWSKRSHWRRNGCIYHQWSHTYIYAIYMSTKRSTQLSRAMYPWDAAITAIEEAVPKEYSIGDRSVNAIRP